MRETSLEAKQKQSIQALGKRHACDKIAPCNLSEASIAVPRQNRIRAKII